MPEDILDIKISRVQRRIDMFQRKKEQIESHMIKFINELSLLQEEKIEKEKNK